MLIVACGAPQAPRLHLSGAVAAESHAAAAEPSHVERTAVEEMLFGSKGQWQHWTAAPALVVLTSVMEYEATDATEYTATSELLKTDDMQELVVDLTDALRSLTNNTFQQFARVEYASVAAGSKASIVRPKQIVVGRYRGVRSLTHTLGFGGRRARPDGTIFGAAVVLDSEFDRTSEMRRLLRTHELGHALGYNHVESRASIMNPRIGAEMTDFDRQIVRAAFEDRAEKAVSR